MKKVGRLVHIILLVLGIIAWSPTFAQLEGQPRIDSLLAELPRQKEDSTHVKLLQMIASEYSEVMPAKGIDYAEQALSLARKLQWNQGIARTYSALGSNYNSMGRTREALESYVAAVKIFGQTGDRTGEARATGNMGTVYRSIGDTTKALACFSKALQIFTELDIKKGIAVYTGNIGNLYCDELHNYPLALEYMSRSLKMFEELGDKSGILRTTYNMGNVYGAQDDFLGAVANYKRSLKMAEEIGNTLQVANNLCNIGSAYIRILELMGTKGSATNPFSTKSREQHGSYIPDGVMPSTKAELLTEGLKNLQQSLSLAQEIGYLSGMVDCQKSLARAYRLSGDAQKALIATEAFYKLRDSVFSVEDNEEVVKMNAEYEYSKKRLADSLRSAQNEKIARIHLQKQKTYTYLGLAGIFIMSVFSFFIVKERKKSERERKKSDELLLNILPTEVAQELKINGTTNARHYDNVTVLFADFVNFTQGSSAMNAQVLIDELNLCFSMFDEITAKHGVEKIKTIGDAYLAVAGLPTPDPAHAVNAVNAAIEINAFMQDRLRKLGNRTFDIRLGIHSGSVVAGVVGVRKFQFDIWGDTVNTAARMEHHSEPGKVNISDTTYELVKNKFSCVFRGDVEVKGKGKLKMYFVQ